MSDAQQKSVGAPGFGESMIPVWGSGREAVNDFQTGHYVKGAFWTVMAVSDLFLVGAVAKGGLKLVGKAGAALLTRESETVATKATVKASAAGLVNGPWRPFGNTVRGLMKEKGLKRFIFDPRKNYRTPYVRLGATPSDIHLHHLFIQKQTKWIPLGFRNAGFNLLELPGSFNRWMGGHFAREFGFRMFFLTTMAGTAIRSIRLGEEINNHLFQQPQVTNPQPQTPGLPRQGQLKPKTKTPPAGAHRAPLPPQLPNSSRILLP